jgi:hypothetical protein
MIRGSVAVVGAEVPVTYEEFADSRLGALLRYAVMLTGDQQHGSSPSAPTAELLAAEPAPAGPLDVLLLGSDNRLRWQDRNRRAGTVMIIHVPGDRTRAYLAALRDDTLPAWIAANPAYVLNRAQR